MQRISMLAKYSLLGFIFQCFTLSSLFATEFNNKFAESVHKVKLNLNARSASVNEVFSIIEENTHFRFAFDTKDINNEAILSLRDGELSVADVLKEVAQNSGLSFKQINNTIYVKKASKKSSDIEVILESNTSAEAKPFGTDDTRVRGKITSGDDGEAMPGVNVVVKGTTKGAVTNINGEFTLDVPEDAVLVVSFIGYQTMEIPVNARSVIEIALKPDVNQLNEVVVIGYGEMTKRDLTGSVASIKSDEIMLMPTHNALEAIKGRVAGLDITRSSGQAGAGVNITLRGNRSISGSNNPLIIIDGYMGGRLEDLNPNDIESMEVLKDASATAIYGSQGANGVIIVTTKKGTAGKMKISYNGFYGVNGLTPFPAVRTGEDYMKLRREAWRTQAERDGVPMWTDDQIFANDGEWAAL